MWFGENGSLKNDLCDFVNKDYFFVARGPNVIHAIHDFGMRRLLCCLFGGLAPSLFAWPCNWSYQQ